MRMENLHSYTLVPVPAGPVKCAMRCLIGSTLFSAAADAHSQFSKDEIKLASKLSETAKFSKAEGAKFNYFNLAMCLNALSTWQPLVNFYGKFSRA